VKVVYSFRHRAHHPEQEFEESRLHEPHEHPGRAEAIRASLATDSRFEFVAPDDHGRAPIEAVHDRGLIDFLETAWSRYQETFGPTHDVVPDVFAHGRLRDGMGEAPAPTTIGAELGYWCFETTTPLTHGTYDAARSSVDVALTAGSMVLGGDRVAYGLCRPPGHHATRSVYGGYCFFNNAAVTAAHLSAVTGSKVAVLDVDYHHGNGTQQIFYEREDVPFVSLHGDPKRAYPYVAGHVDETGVGAGAGATLNLPLPAGTEDDRYLAVLGDALEWVTSSGAAMVVVSLGLDTYHLDPISDLGLTADGLERCGELVASAGLPLVILQEGGYATDDLGENTRRWLSGALSGVGGAPGS